MLILISKRLGLMALTMLAVSILVFLLLEINIHGVATKVLGPYSSQDQREIWLKDNGYFDPLHQRYLRWLGNFVVGDLGHVPARRDVSRLGFLDRLGRRLLGLLLGRRDFLLRLIARRHRDATQHGAAGVRNDAGDGAHVVLASGS